MSCHYVDVLLPVPLDGLFTYSVPPEMEASAERGRRVLVPFGRNKTHVGIIMKVHADKPKFICGVGSPITTCAPPATCSPPPCPAA